MFCNRFWAAGRRRAATKDYCVYKAAALGFAGVALGFSQFVTAAAALEPQTPYFPMDLASVSTPQPVVLSKARMPVPMAKPELPAIETASAHGADAILDKSTSKLQSVVRSAAGTSIDMRWSIITSQMDSITSSSKCLKSSEKCEVGVLNTWGNLIKSARKLPRHKQLSYVNRGINALISYKSDQQVWGQSDYWASPIETLSQRRGDCEDYAVLKYWTLRELGIPAEDMKVVAVYDTKIGQYHAILNLSYKGGEYVLDNRFGRVALKQDTKNYKWVHVAGSGQQLPQKIKYTSLAAMTRAFN
ncbi:transglutaminase-like cysteine peptidase [Pseudovibrio brasiliensis]|uniref:Transglutaminase-like cysteine peptidase n=1 Tax=Pseudovibrio brasiliensis TaxID=1898042 RepID=A0ABX8AKE2_9HYPH|nr:transglutaminase-like cysteine peptidase [Pseudovibrio brasiliensis]QUS54385.1 transglutaminase-like cysteine peptidase [Pseudovibrio brasiliensis]